MTLGMGMVISAWATCLGMSPFLLDYRVSAGPTLYLVCCGSLLYSLPHAAVFGHGLGQEPAAKCTRQ